MSLLIEALKQAEARKKPKPAAAGTADPAPADDHTSGHADPASTASADAVSQTPASSSGKASTQTPASGPGRVDDELTLELSLEPGPDAHRPDHSTQLADELADGANLPPQASPARTADATSAAPGKGSGSAGSATTAPAVANEPSPKSIATSASTPAPSALAAAPSNHADAAPAAAAAGTAPPVTAADSAKPTPALRTGGDGNASPQQTAQALLKAAQSERLLRQRKAQSSGRKLALLGGLIALPALLLAGYFYLSQPSNRFTAPPAADPAQTAASDVETKVAEDAASAAEPVPPAADNPTLGNESDALQESVAPLIEPVKQALEAGLDKAGQTAAELSGQPPSPSTEDQAQAAAPPPRPAAFTQPTIGIEKRPLRAEPKLVRVEQPGSPLQDAYAALNQGQLDQAERLYRQALARQPRHPDALLGLASIAERRGLFEVAQRRYREVLHSDPGNPIALSAVLAGLQIDQLPAAESELRSALAQHPQHAALYFALGNVLAQRQRWSEAQQAYFEAANRAPSNPDYAFNLAVALDRLAKVELAARFYRQALQLAQTRPGGFAPSAAERRLQQIEDQLQGQRP